MMKNYADDIIKILNKSYYLYNTSVVSVESCIDVVKCLVCLFLFHFCHYKTKTKYKNTQTHYDSVATRWQSFTTTTTKKVQEFQKKGFECLCVETA